MIQEEPQGGKRKAEEDIEEAPHKSQAIEEEPILNPDTVTSVQGRRLNADEDLSLVDDTIRQGMFSIGMSEEDINQFMMEDKPKAKKSVRWDTDEAKCIQAIET